MPFKFDPVCPGLIHEVLERLPEWYDRHEEQKKKELQRCVLGPMLDASRLETRDQDRRRNLLVLADAEQDRIERKYLYLREMFDAELARVKAQRADQLLCN